MTHVSTNIESIDIINGETIILTKGATRWIDLYTNETDYWMTNVTRKSEEYMPVRGTQAPAYNLPGEGGWNPENIEEK